MRDIDFVRGGLVIKYLCIAGCLVVVSLLLLSNLYPYQPKQETEYLEPYIPEPVCLTWVQAKQKYGALGMEFMINQRCE